VDTLCRERLNDFRAALESDGAIAAVYLFGSHARGSATPMSDIDLAILFSSAVDASRYFSLRLEYISRAMEILRTEKVDVVILNQAPLHLAYEIVSRGVLLLDCDSQSRVRFEADRVGQFLDFKPFLAVQTRALRQQLKGGTFFD
jgi:predicted nucleotidyltransferase